MPLTFHNSELPWLQLLTDLPLSVKIIFLIIGLLFENLTFRLTVIYLLSTFFPFIVSLTSYFVNFQSLNFNFMINIFLLIFLSPHDHCITFWCFLTLLLIYLQINKAQIFVLNKESSQYRDICVNFKMSYSRK